MAPGIGHNSSDVFDMTSADSSDDMPAADALRSFVERIERMDEEIKGSKDDRKDILLEAKAQGFDTKTMLAIIRLRRMNKDDRDEADALLDTYKSALGMG